MANSTTLGTYLKAISWDSKTPLVSSSYRTVGQPSRDSWNDCSSATISRADSSMNCCEIISAAVGFSPFCMPRSKLRELLSPCFEVITDNRECRAYAPSRCVVQGASLSSQTRVSDERTDANRVPVGAAETALKSVQSRVNVCTRPGPAREYGEC